MNGEMGRSAKVFEDVRVAYIYTSFQAGRTSPGYSTLNFDRIKMKFFSVVRIFFLAGNSVARLPNLFGSPSSLQAMRN